MAWAMPNLLNRDLDTDGDTINAGKLYVFAAGTTTPSTIYSNNALGATHSNPIVADSGGLFAEYWLSPGSYKIRYTDADGNTLQEIDNYVVPDLTLLGSAEFPVVAKTSDYTVVAADAGTIFAVDASAAPGSLVTITASSTTLTNGFLFGIKNIGSSGTVTLAPAGGETVEGDSSYSITGQNIVTLFDSRGAAGWYIVATTSSLSQSIAFAGDISPSQITSDQDNYNPTGLSAASVIRISTDATRNITGLQGGADGRIIIIHNVGTTNSAVLVDDSSSSDAANRFSLPGSVDMILGPDGSVMLWYDSTSTRWRTVSKNSAASQAMMESEANNSTFVTPGRQRYNPGHPKFHAFVTVSAGSPTLNAVSYNMTSITDTGQGILTLTIATDFSSANWGNAGSCELVDTSVDAAADLRLFQTATKAAGTLQVQSLTGEGPPSYEDPTAWTVVGFGDHA